MTGAAEFVAADAALADLPDAWVSDGLAAAVERRAVLETAARLLTEQADRARAAIECAAAEVTGGDYNALDALVAAHAELAAIRAAQTTLPSGELDPEVVRAALQNAQGALDAADRRLAVPVPDFDADLARWRQSCAVRGQLYEPPIPTELDREASARAEEMAAQVERAWAGSRAWRTDAARGSGDPMAMLRAAVGHLASVDALAGQIAEVTELIDQANAHRAAEGLTWRHPMASDGVLY